ncbi:cytochrome B561 [Desulfoplanes formicivorans]|uniref:Cytochrome B561 n=2 Tax=Desulfoplanes formicivorans TaxID=1592317 RepID=A0A194ACJ2_9BACT|nr:cytochrome B561 [Desulfoplanes formicivorans]
MLDRLWEVAARKGAERVLMAVSFTEAIFFPVPPDLLLLPMGLAARDKVFRLAWICLLFSLAGGVIGYGIGYYFMEAVGNPIIRFYGLEEQYTRIQVWYDTYSAWAVSIAGLTPIPYKLCTLTAGAFHINWPVFILASAISRGIRFFVIAVLIRSFGEAARTFLEKRFNLVVTVTLILVILGFVVLKYV